MFFCPPPSHKTKGCQRLSSKKLSKLSAMTTKKLLPRVVKKDTVSVTCCCTMPQVLLTLWKNSIILSRRGTLELRVHWLSLFFSHPHRNPHVGAAIGLPPPQREYDTRPVAHQKELRSPYGPEYDSRPPVEREYDSRPPTGREYDARHPDGRKYDSRPPAARYDPRDERSPDGSVHLHFGDRYDVHGDFNARHDYM